MKKRVLALAFILAIMPLAALASQSPTFRDVPASHPAYSAIRWVASPANGAFMVGDAGNNFNPNANVSVFEAASIFASAAGFRHVTIHLPPAEREVFTRSFEAWRTPLEALAMHHAQWNATFDREIAFLLYHQILTVADINTFINANGQVSNITREWAVAWMVRLLDMQDEARAMQLPNPFNDEALINQNFRNYMHFAHAEGIIQPTGGNINPTQVVTRAQMATLFYNAFYQPGQQPSQPAQDITTVIGTIELLSGNNVVVRAGNLTHTLTINANTVIMLDNIQQPLSALAVGMELIALTNPQRVIISLSARTAANNSGAGQGTQVVPPGTTPQNLNSDEGFVISATENSVVILTQRVRINGEIVNEERSFNLAHNASVTRAGAPSSIDYVQTGDMAFFRFNGNTIHELELVERERTINGILSQARPAATPGGSPMFIVEVEGGRLYELRVTPATQFTRNGILNLNWGDIRTGDSLVITTEYDRITSVHAIGVRTTVSGRLTEILIRENNTQITLALPNGTFSSYVVAPGVFDVYTLRIGQNLSVQLDSREVIDITVQGGSAANDTTLLGYIQTIHPNGNITVAVGQGSARRTVTLTVNTNTVIMRAGSTINRNQLQLNMNVIVTIQTPQSTVAQSITVLP